MSYDMIIDETDIDNSGRFRFDTRYLPAEDNIYRIHISKRNDSPASLIIGGKDENHFFIIANNSTKLLINDTSNCELFKNLVLKGYYPNIMIQQVDQISNYLDTTYTGSFIKTELIRSAISEKLRVFADTCSNPLVALYALQQSNFENNYPINQQYYRNFLSRWRKQNSLYFTEFRKKVPLESEIGVGIAIGIGAISLLLGIILYWGYLKFSRKNKNPLQNLSVQERKIFSLLLEGKSNKEISETLIIGISTVKSHIYNIYSKLDISSRKDVMNFNLEKDS